MPSPNEPIDSGFYLLPYEETNAPYIKYQSANDQAGKVDSRCDCFKKKEDGQITEATGIL